MGRRCRIVAEWAFLALAWGVLMAVLLRAWPEPAWPSWADDRHMFEAGLNTFGGFWPIYLKEVKE